MLRGSLFTRDFLEDGIREAGAWAAMDDAELRRLHNVARDLFAALGRMRQPNEAVTETDLIYPLLSQPARRMTG